jgi:hypothetical protein
VWLSWEGIRVEARLFVEVAWNQYMPFPEEVATADAVEQMLASLVSYALFSAEIPSLGGVSLASLDKNIFDNARFTFYVAYYPHSDELTLKVDRVVVELPKLGVIISSSVNYDFKLFGVPEWAITSFARGVFQAYSDYERGITSTVRSLPREGVWGNKEALVFSHKESLPLAIHEESLPEESLPEESLPLAITVYNDGTVWDRYNPDMPIAVLWDENDSTMWHEFLQAYRNVTGRAISVEEEAVNMNSKQFLLTLHELGWEWNY